MSAQKGNFSETRHIFATVLQHFVQSVYQKSSLQRSVCGQLSNNLQKLTLRCTFAEYGSADLGRL